MEESLNTIAIRHLDRMVVPEGKGTGMEGRAVLAFQSELARYGYTLGGKAIEAMAGAGDETRRICEETIKEVADKTGAQRNYEPLFRDFPEIPDEATYLEARIVASMQRRLGLTPKEAKVLGCGHAIDERMFALDAFGACPVCQCQDEYFSARGADKRQTENHTIRILGTISEQGMRERAKGMLGGPSAIGKNEREFVEDVWEHSLKQPPVPERMEVRENRSWTAAKLARAGDEEQALEVMTREGCTTTDGLRVANVLSGGEASLAERCKIRLPRTGRRLVSEVIEHALGNEHAIEDMKRRRERFLRLGEVLHAGASRTRFPKTAQAFDTLRNDAKGIETFNATIESMATRARKEPASAAAMARKLVGRPGEMARRVDFMLRNATGHEDEVLEQLQRAAPALSMRMLLELKAHFRSRGEQQLRWFIPKAGYAKVATEQDRREPIAEPTANKAVEVIERTLEARLTGKERMGTVLVEPGIAKLVLPVDRRSATSSDVRLGRGSRTPVEHASMSRFFVWWKETDASGTVDVDLSATFYTPEWEERGHVSYTALRTRWATHSGDIRSAPHGASEFIDINRSAFIEENVRYALMNVMVYSGQGFDTIRCHAGIMGRASAEGRTFDPSTVRASMEIKAPAVHAVPLLYDAMTNEMIWVDVYVGGQSRGVNVEGSMERLAALVRVAEQSGQRRASFLDLAMANAKARADTVHEQRDAETQYDHEFTVASVRADPGGVVEKWMTQ